MLSIWTSLKLCLAIKSYLFKSLNNKILALTKLKAFADDNFIATEMMISVYDLVENIVEKGENAGYQHFLLFPQCFQKLPAKPHCSVGGFMIVIARGFIPLSLLSIVSTMVQWESSQWLGKNIVRNTG